MIHELRGSDLGVYRNGNYWLNEWSDSGRVVFSATQQGQSLNCHFAANKKALRHVKTAIKDYVEWLFNVCEWCKMVIAVIEKPSVERIVKKCGFVKFGETVKGKKLYMRVR